MISVIVAVYKDAESLGLILNALEKQSYKDFEIIVAEDCSSNEIKNCLEKYKYLNIKHTSQEDSGWRKNASLNNAIRIAEGELLVFIDGDCIPSIDFVKGYSRHQKDNTVLCGRRIELGPLYSTRLRQGQIDIVKVQNNYLLNYFSMMKDKTRHYEEGLHLSDFLYHLKHNNKKASLLGCNFAVNKKDLIEINGFNEDYVTPSVGEDTDIEFRLRLKGCAFKSIRNKSFVFHLFHEETYDELSNATSKKVFTKVKDGNIMVCENGLNK